ncbi:MAG TPA: serine/threonine-protein kinase, partial [Phycisphaerales bacterium]|nr:serine/threonine-protein kinase [Phycisphaerales bacterium]
YQLEEALGSGTQGVVFRAMDRLLAADGRPLSVAVKLLHAWQTDGEQEASREAARATRIRHPGIAALLNCGSAEGQPYLVYDFIDGAPLDRWRARQAEIGERQAAKIVLQLAHAVQVAHNAGVVHRDLKPTNILMDRGGAPHITDFGLAAAMHRGKGDGPVGSLGFAAPEQLRAETGGEDASVDVYALGGLLFWLLTGQFPNGGSPAEVRERLGGGGSADAPDPAARCPGLDRTLGAICARALAPLARDRYASAAVLAVDLERWLAREPVMPFDRSVVRRARLWTRRSPAAAVAALVGAALILGSLGLAWRADLARRTYAFEQQLEMLRVRQEEQERRIEGARGLIQSMMRTMEKVKADSADLTWLPLVSGFESIGGDHGVDVTGMEGQMDHARIAAVRNHLASAAGTGAGDSVEIAVWETMLAFLLLKSERAHEAVPVLETNIARVERLFPADDPWRRNVTALRDLALFMNDPDPMIADGARSRLELVAGELPENIGRLVSDTLSRPAAQSRLDR